MKIQIDIECTPEEARRFLGLPDVRPMQEAMVEELRRRMLANLEAMEPETLIKTWLPVGLQGLENVQKIFWTQLNEAMSEAQKRQQKKSDDEGGAES